MPPNSNPLKPDGTLNFEALGLAPPAHFEHGTTDEVRANLRPLRPTRWYQRGNELVAETELGDLVNLIPTNYLLTGTDEKGWPILKKLDS